MVLCRILVAGFAFMATSAAGQQGDRYPQQVPAQEGEDATAQPVPYAVAQAVKKGDTTASVEGRLGKPSKRSAALCNPAREGDECWAYSVSQHQTWTRLVVRFRGDAVEDWEWSHPGTGVALAGGSVSLTEMGEPIAKTPTGRSRERIRLAEERRAEAKRTREAKVAARSSALKALCDLGAERQRDMQEISMEQSGACGGSGMSPGAFQCNNGYENAKMRVISRYEARMARFRAHAERQLGRSLTQRDCCAALPSRFQFYGDNCIQYR